MDPISPNCFDHQCMISYKYVRSVTSMNTISNKSKPSVRLKGNRSWKKSWSRFAYNKNVILMVRMMRLWSSLSFWERESDCLLGEGGLRQSSFTLYRSQNNIMGHWAATPGTSPAWSELRASDQSTWHRWVSGRLRLADPRDTGECLGGYTWPIPAPAPASSNHSTRSSCKGGGSSCTNLVSAEMLERKWIYLLRKSWMCCW